MQYEIMCIVEKPLHLQLDSNTLKSSRLICSIQWHQSKMTAIKLNFENYMNIIHIIINQRDLILLYLLINAHIWKLPVAKEQR